MSTTSPELVRLLSASTRVAVLGASKRMKEAAKELFPEVVYLEGPSFAPEAERQMQAWVTSTRNQLESLPSVSTVAVVAVSETAQLPAARLSEAMRALGTSVRLVQATRNKLLMREILAEFVPQHNLPSVSVRELDAVERLLESGPGIAKPVDGTGSSEVYSVPSWEEFLRLRDKFSSKHVLERMATGVEVTVEALSWEGKHRVFGMAEKFIDSNFVEIGHVMPPPSIPPDGLREIEVAIEAVLDALQFSNSVSCTEVFWTPGNVHVVETHTRLAGDGIADLVAITTGVDWRQTALAAPLGVGPISSSASKRAPSAATVFFSVPGGRVARTLTEPPKLNGIQFAEWRIRPAAGDRVKATVDSSGRLGMALMLGDSPQLCKNAVETLLDMAVILVEED